MKRSEFNADRALKEYRARLAAERKRAARSDIYVVLTRKGRRALFNQRYGWPLGGVHA